MGVTQGLDILRGFLTKARYHRAFMLVYGDGRHDLPPGIVTKVEEARTHAGPGFEPSATDPESGIVRTMLVPSYYHLRYHLCGWVRGASWGPNDIFSRASPVKGGRKG